MASNSKYLKIQTLKEYLDQAEEPEIEALYKSLQDNGNLAGRWNWENDEDFIKTMEEDVTAYEQGDISRFISIEQLNEGAIEILKSKRVSNNEV
jgi:hypothetical protein